MDRAAAQSASRYDPLGALSPQFGEEWLKASNGETRLPLDFGGAAAIDYPFQPAHTPRPGSGRDHDHAPELRNAD
jgi:hypothetical protein